MRDGLKMEGEPVWASADGSKILETRLRHLERYCFIAAPDLRNMVSAYIARSSECTGAGAGAGVERVVVDKLGLRHSGGRFLVETQRWQLPGYGFSMFRHKNVYKCKHNQMFDLQSAEMGQMTIEPQKT